MYSIIIILEEPPFNLSFQKKNIEMSILGCLFQNQVKLMGFEMDYFNFLMLIRTFNCL